MDGTGKRAIKATAHIEDVSVKQVMAIGVIEDAGERDALVTFMKSSKKLTGHKSIFPACTDPQ